MARERLATADDAVGRLSLQKRQQQRFDRRRFGAWSAALATVALDAVVELDDVPPRVPPLLFRRRVLVAVVARIHGEVFRILMAGRAGVILLAVGDRKDVVFEGGAFPRRRRVAIGAAAAIAELVYRRHQRLGVARDARLRRPFEDVVDVAILAIDALVLAGQFETGAIVVEILQAGGRQRRAGPGRGRVTEAAISAEFPQMHGRLGVAADARLRGALEHIIDVARLAIGGLVFARELEAGVVVVEMAQAGGG